MATDSSQIQSGGIPGGQGKQLYYSLTLRSEHFNENGLQNHINYMEGLYRIPREKQHCALTTPRPPDPVPLPPRARTAGTHTHTQGNKTTSQNTTSRWFLRHVVFYDGTRGPEALLARPGGWQRPVPASLGAGGAKSGGQRRESSSSIATSRPPGQAWPEVLQHWNHMQQGGKTPPIPFKAQAMPATPPRENADDLGSPFTRRHRLKAEGWPPAALGGAGGAGMAPGGAPGLTSRVADVSHQRAPQS